MLNRICFAAAAAALLAAGAGADELTVKVPEGTEIRLETVQAISSKTAEEGDRVSFRVLDDVVVADAVVVAKGAVAKGEVTEAERRGFLGKGGKLRFRIEYVKAVDDGRIAVRSARAADGKESVKAAAILTGLLGPVGLLKRGKDVTLPEGALLTVFTDEDRLVAVPGPAAVATAR